MSARISFAFAAVLAFTSAAASAEIVRCVGASGAVTYQQIPCPEAALEKVVAIPTEFPPPNIAERDRLLEREAALYRRLEARRDRETQEAALRNAREERELERARLAAAEAAAAQAPQYLLILPPRHLRPHHGRPPVRYTSTLR